MILLKLFFVVIVGIIAGFININAGGGSLLSLPVLIFLGLPSTIANGTNRVALVVEGIMGSANFKRKGLLDIKLSLLLSIPAVIGSLLGAKLAISLTDKTFNIILGFVMIFVLIQILISNKKSNSVDTASLNKIQKLVSAITFFFVGFYGGFIQVGVGFIIIVSLSVITKFSLLKINGLKAVIIPIYLITSLIIFIVSGKINWLFAIFLALGNGIGAWIGAHYATKKGDKLIKIILIVAVSALSFKLFGLFTYLANLFK